jgi:Family of unknown function (DUF6500)
MDYCRSGHHTDAIEVAVDESMRTKIIEVCDRKIAEKGTNVGLSFYAFFANKNDDPELLLEVATWWIQTHRLDHFEKAVKIRSMMV